MQDKPLGFPKSVRLLTKAEYQAVFEHSCMVSDSMLVVFVLPNTLDTARLGLAISRKCSKKAVDRNHVKRTLRETFRVIRPQLPNLDFVVICRVGAAKQPGSVLKASFLKQITKIHQRKCAGLL